MVLLHYSRHATGDGLNAGISLSKPEQIRRLLIGTDILQKIVTMNFWKRDGERTLILRKSKTGEVNREDRDRQDMYLNKQPVQSRLQVLSLS